MTVRYRGHRLSTSRRGSFSYLFVRRAGSIVHVDYHDNPPSPGRDIERLKAWVDAHHT